MGPTILQGTPHFSSRKKKKNEESVKQNTTTSSTGKTNIHRDKENQRRNRNTIPKKLSNKGNALTKKPILLIRKKA